MKKLAIKLTENAERILKKGHPWIFSDSIVKMPTEAASGDVAVVFSQKDNKLIGVGLYDLDSPIRIKILKANGPLNVDENFFVNSIQTALDRRKSSINHHTTAYRLIYGESDALPGLIADVYNHIVVLKLYSSIWAPYLEWIKAALVAVLQPEAIVLRLSRNVTKSNTELENGSVIYGALENPLIVFKEYDVLFSAHLIDGHKTGYFLDHRYNRHLVGTLSKGKSVLDVFAYAGGFSVHALAGGAENVVSVDISEQALNVAKSNAALNNFKGTHETLKGDAFEILKNMIAEGQQFDIVVIDPPSFAKQQTEVGRALKQYEVLAKLGVQLCRKGGTLVLASCSSRVNEADFLQAHKNAFSKLGYRPLLLQTTQHDWDHPISIPETAYLKTAYYKI